MNRYTSSVIKYPTYIYSKRTWDNVYISIENMCLTCCSVWSEYLMTGGVIDGGKTHLSPSYSSLVVIEIEGRETEEERVLKEKRK